MNVALATYYGLLDFTKTSSAQAPDISEMVALRYLYDVRGSSVDPFRLLSVEEKRSGLGADAFVQKDSGVTQALEILGGVQQARVKLSQAEPWLRTWSEAEKDGVTLARNAMEHQIDLMRSGRMWGARRDRRA